MHLRSSSSRMTNSRVVVSHCRVTQAISLNSTGFSVQQADQPTRLHLGDEGVIRR